jgi:glycerol-3-phosphate acyltransferase PlsY
MGSWLTILLAYAAGCVSFALLVARAHGVDIRTLGSGNPGATNVGRVLGPRWGACVLVLDIAKGLLPALLLSAPPAALGIGELPPWAVDGDGRVLVAGAVVLGHVWPVTQRFRGGKGVATFIGALLGLDPALCLAAVLVHVLVKKGLGFVSLASVCLVWTVPGAQLLLGALAPSLLQLAGGTAVLALLAAVITWRHRENFRRLRSGTESRYDARVPAQRTQDETRS